MPTPAIPGVVVLSHEMGRAVEQNKGADPLGMGDCEVDRRPRTPLPTIAGRWKPTASSRAVTSASKLPPGIASRGSPSDVPMPRPSNQRVQAEAIQPPADPDEARVFQQEIDRDRTGTVEHQL
jgi:hypothetical protein